MTIEAKNRVLLSKPLGIDISDSKDITLEEFIKKYYIKTIDDLNEVLFELSFVDNFNGQIKEKLKIPASTTVRVYHKLQVIPFGRQILKQVGGGLITDGEYTNKYIELTNNGASEAVLTLNIYKR